MPACRRRAAPLRRNTQCCGLLGADEVAAAVLLPAGLVALRAERFFLAEADGGHAVGRAAQRDEVLLHGAGAAIAERQVVFRGAALVAVAFDGHAKLRVVAQELGGLSERLASVRANVRLVEVEVGIANFIEEDLVQIRLRRFLHRRRRSSDSYARGGVRGAAGPLAVMVYVVESPGVTFVEPSALTVPTSGAMVSCVAFVELQLNVEDSPLVMEVGPAESVTVGCGLGCS